MTLHDQQSALIAALAGNAPVPAGFDAGRVQAAASALAFKRARAVAQAWPSLRVMLGDDFRARFGAYAASTPLPQQGGPLADGLRFVHYLARQMPLADEVKLQQLSVDARYRRTRTGLSPRRYPRIRVAWLAKARCTVIALGAWRFRLQWPRFG